MITLLCPVSSIMGNGAFSVSYEWLQKAEIYVLSVSVTLKLGVV